MKFYWTAILLIFLSSASTLAGETALTDSQPVRVMTFNIRFGTAPDGPNVWEARRSQVIEVIREFSPAILGTQEALRFQLDEILNAFPNLAIAGVGRTDGQSEGEHSAILYDRTRLQLLEQGTFWFSETPNVPGSMAWGANLPRICSWIRCRDHSSGRVFYAYNVHWDHQSQVSREKSAELLVQRISQRSDLNTSIILTGDFNAGEKTVEFKRLLACENHALIDTFRETHPSEQLAGTFNGFRGKTDGAKIDAVLISNDWQVKEANIVRTNYDGRYPSDHFPVTAVIRFGSH